MDPKGKQSRCEPIALADDPSKGGVDFQFDANGDHFLLEVTNISTDTATKYSGMPDTEKKDGAYGFLTPKIRGKIRRKLSQAQRHSNQPVLVAVTTLHWNAGALCVNHKAVEFAMGSTPAITCRINKLTGETVGEPYQSTDLSQSTFLSPTPVFDADGNPTIQAKYEPISGFLLGSIGLSPKDVSFFGGLNPNADHPFNPQLLSDIPFCSFTTWPASKSIEFSWTITEEEEQSQKQFAAERRIRKEGLGHILDAFRRES